MASQKSFIEELDKEALEFFVEVSEKPFQEQAVSFLNAYWDEVGETQAEFIYGCSWERMRYADMEARGISLVHLYEEGNHLTLDIGLYFYEQLCKKVEQSKEWGDEKYKSSHPEVLTAIKRKQELREKVDVNFTGKISFLEVLLHQYREFANPADFTRRAMKSQDEHPEVRKARLALEEVNRAIKAYEAERFRLEEGAKRPGVAGLQFKHSLAILDESPLRTDLNEKLIHAEAAVRIATRKFGGAKGGSASGDSAESGGDTRGTLWWMNRDLAEKKKRYPSKK